MNLEQYSPEELKEVSMIELAYTILEEKKQVVTFQDIVNEVTEILGLTKNELTSKIAQFYTDLNIDGRFICLGENRWGLRSWYPYEQIDEEILPQPKAKPKKKRKKEEDHDDPIVADDGFDDIEDVDDLDELDDEDDLIEDDEDIDEDIDGDIDEDIIDDDEDEDLDDLEEAAVFVEDDEEGLEDDEESEETDDKEEKL